jgi:2-dehydro-3-deoxygluconokinase
VELVMARIAVIGEALLELTHSPGTGDKLGFGGDTLNTAIYLARLGNAPHFISALGTDPYSDHLLRQWEKECVQVGHVLRHPSRLPGLYAIQTDHAGERSFYYWRENSAARAFFEMERAGQALAFAREADWLYLSGITLSIFDEAGREALGLVAQAVKARGGNVVFDPNYRPRGWRDAEEAQKAIADIGQHVTLALPTIEDENALYGQVGGAAHAARWAGWNVPQIVLKCGSEGAILYGETGDTDGVRVPVEATIKPIDTTGAGDSFNAAFIGACLDGKDVISAARAGNRLAGSVIQHRGAVIPREAMPDLSLDRAQ